MALRRLLTCFAILLLPWPVHAEDSSQAEFFHGKIEPILIGHCLDCHNAAKKGGLDLRSKATALAGGDSGSVLESGSPDDSLLFQYVAAKEMPPKNPLSDHQIAAIKKWIADGAWYPEKPLNPFAITTDTRAGFDWWSLQPLTAEVPAANEAPANWQAHPIDRFIHSKLNENGLEPSKPALPRALIRRATYDLLGLPPTPHEVDEFLEACARETGKSGRVGDKAYAALIDRLLASQHYGEQWGRHWLDVVRFGESNGFERNVIHTTVWPFRDYVIRSLNTDKPFDRFIREHLAGDALAPNDPAVAVATAFLVCGPYDNVGNQDAVAAAQIRANTIDEIIRATSGSFLGLTVGCSRCHDHKFDPISQRDYYSLYATFAGVRHGERTIQAKPAPEKREVINELENELATLEAKLREFEPIAFTGRTIFLDDEQTKRNDNGTPAVEHLVEESGRGGNPPGSQRGYRDDPGAIDRVPNISRGGYVWWHNRPGTDVFSYHPAADGMFRVWLSWGCGWPAHTRDARYFLDADGDLTTKDDRKLIASVDQRYFVGGGPEPLPKVPLWSGLFDAGIHEFQSASKIVLQCGKSGEAITTDCIVLQEHEESSASVIWPQLRSPVNPRVNVERIAPVRARYVRFTVSATNTHEPCLDELEIFRAGDEAARVNVALAAAGAKATSSGNYVGNPKHQLQHVHDGKYGNSFSWISNENGKGWVQIELARVEQIDRIVWGRDREQQYQDRLPTSYVIETAVEPGHWQVVATSADRLSGDAPSNNGSVAFASLSADQAEKAKPLTNRWKEVAAELEQHRVKVDSPKWWVGNFSQQNGPFHTFVGGSPQQHGAEVHPASLNVLADTDGYDLPSNSAEPLRRLKLAEWITADDNPLTPRVLANRIWHYHFGTGIVNTPSDFGFMGGRPSHPALLDWLALRLKEHGWRLKPLHREIMLSRTYRQASSYREDAAKIDGNSRLLWRFPPRRLEAEEIRDATLAVAGKLNPEMYGPGFRLFRYVQDNVATYHPLDEHGPETYRRGVYHHRARAMQIDLLSEFDSPDCAFSAPRRSTTTTPLQALTLMNHQFTVDMAEALTERIHAEAGDEVPMQISRAYQLAFSRQPDQEEAGAASRLIEAHGLRAFCRALLNANEFIYLE